MEHPGAVVLHLRRHEVEVPRLVVRDADVEPVGPDSVTRSVGRPDGRLGRFKLMTEAGKLCMGITMREDGWLL